MKLGMLAAEEGYLVTFGIKPTRPETGFGYIQMGETMNGFHKAKRFVEKPDLETARKYVKTMEVIIGTQACLGLQQPHSSKS